MVVDDSVLKHSVSYFFRDEDVECKILIKCRFGKAHELMLPAEMLFGTS